MHRDTRTGLALGILLVGIVAALFFRDESQPVPQLEDPQSLDAEIAEKTVVPYLLSEPPDADHEEETSVASHARTKIAGAAPPDPIPLKNQHVQFGVVAPTSTSAQSVANPNIEQPQHKLTGQTSDDFHYHVVEPGDTLTSLAVEYLGNSSRYPEIYRLNRNVLNDPNNLPAGVRIRIPRKKPPRRADRQTKPNRVSRLPESSQTVSDSLAADDAKSPSTDDTDRQTKTAENSDRVILNIRNSSSEPEARQGKPPEQDPPVVKRFVPVQRSPFGSRRTNQQD